MIRVRYPTTTSELIDAITNYPTAKVIFMAGDTSLLSSQLDIDSCVNIDIDKDCYVEIVKRCKVDDIYYKDVKEARKVSGDDSLELETYIAIKLK